MNKSFWFAARVGFFSKKALLSLPSLKIVLLPA